MKAPLVRGGGQHGQALAAVLVIMALLFLLVGGVTMALSALVRQQGPNRTQTTNDLAAQNAVAATAADVSGGQSACGQPADGSPLVAAPQFNTADWDLQGPWSGSTGTMLAFNPGGADLTGVATAHNGASWTDYAVIVKFAFPGGMAPGTSIELDAGVQGAGTGYFVALQQPLKGSPQWQVGLAGNAVSPIQLSNKQPSSVTLELDGIGGVITGRVSSGPWNPAPVSLTSSIPAGTVAVTVTSAAEVDVTSVKVAPGVPPSEELTVAPPSGTQGFQCQRLDQVGEAASVSQQRITLSPPLRSCPSAISLAPPVTIAPNQSAKLWFTVASPPGTQVPALRVDLATNRQCPYPSSGSSSGFTLADCGNQRSTNWDPAVTAVAASCTAAPSGSQGPYYVYLTALSGTEIQSLPISRVDLHWAPSGSASVYMTVASIPGQRYEEGDLVVGQGSLALTYEGLRG